MIPAMGEHAAHAADRVLSAPWVFHAVRGLIDPGQVRHLRRLLARVPHASVLDVGCGIGSLCGMTDAPYTGVDLDAGYVAYARSTYGAPGRRFETGDALALDPALGHHDLVTLINFIHHLSDDEVRRCLTAVRAVSPARLLVVDVARERAGFLFHRIFGPHDRGAHFRTQPAQRALLEGAGWRVEWEDGYAAGIGIYPHSVLAAVPA